jgi:hypothetical protein
MQMSGQVEGRLGLRNQLSNQLRALRIAPEAD